MAHKSDNSRGGAARGWLSRLDPGPKLTPEDIERDAAAQLGINGGTSPRPLEEPHAAPEPFGDDDFDEQVVPEQHGERRRRDGGRWLRDLVSSEPAAARRERLEAEARAELGLPDQHPEPRAT